MLCQVLFRFNASVFLFTNQELEEATAVFEYNSWEPLLSNQCLVLPLINRTALMELTVTLSNRFDN